MNKENPQDGEAFQCRIQGMDCPDCAAKVEKVVSEISGVTEVHVDFAGETLSAQVSAPEGTKRVRDTVRSLGYGVVEGTHRVTSVLRVEGMDCAEETALVEKALTGLPGLERFEVNLMTERLTVVHDNSTLPAGHLIAALDGVGLKAAPFGESREVVGLWQRHGRLVSTLTAGVFTAIGLVLHFIQPGSPWEKLVYALAILSGGWFIARKGVAAARHGALDMNFLMSVAVVGALFIDAWDEAAMVVFLFALAQVLEGRAMDRARHAVRSLMELAPPVARVLREGKEVTVAVDEVQIDDLFRLRPGEKVPLDGEIRVGHSAINQAPITGESVPVDKAPGDSVYAGSINGEGSLDVRVTHKAADTTLAHIIHLIEEAQAARAPSQAFVDRFARFYTPIVLLLAVLITVLPPLLFGQPFGDWFYRALVLLVIACPCALVISTPVAIVSGLARGARAGVLIKGGVHLENVGHLKALAIDKTGTLTEGRPRVRHVEAINATAERDLIRIAASLESRSEHPLAQAIREHAQSMEVQTEPVDDFRAMTGRGVQGCIQGQDYLLGNHRLFEERGLCTPEVEAVLDRHEAEGETVVILGDQNKIMGFIAIADKVRPEAKSSLERIRRSGIQHIVMLTGDNPRTAQTIAGELGIDEAKSELLPEDKVQAVKDLVARYARIGMVGDGVNDAPAMAAATTGIAMGAAGSDAALETADLVLMSDDLSRLPFAIRLSRSTLRAIQENITIALGLKAIFLVLAVLGQATLWMAVFADMGASLIVIANSLRLLKIPDR